MSQGEGPTSTSAPAKPRSPARVYDRPERSGLFPVIFIIVAVAVLLVGYFLYRAYFQTPAPSTPPTGIILVGKIASPASGWQEGMLDVRSIRTAGDR